MERSGFTASECYGFNTKHGYGFAPYAPPANSCVTIGTGTDGGGTWEGYLNGVSGSIVPQYTTTDQFTYTLRWYANGDFIASFGVGSDEKIPDTDIVFILYQGYTAALTWNSTTTQYEGVESELATLLMTDYNVADTVCFNIRFVPNLFIQYNFELMRGSAL